jgi:hypothetical protein
VDLVAAQVGYLGAVTLTLSLRHVVIERGLALFETILDSVSVAHGASTERKNPLTKAMAAP